MQGWQMKKWTYLSSIRVGKKWPLNRGENKKTGGGILTPKVSLRRIDEKKSAFGEISISRVQGRGLCLRLKRSHRSIIIIFKQLINNVCIIFAIEIMMHIPVHHIVMISLFCSPYRSTFIRRTT